MGFRLTCVTDTNVWIDLYVGGILEKTFELPFRFIAPDVVINELKRPEGHYLILLGLQSYELTGQQVLGVYEIAQKHRNPSRVDLFALVLAKDLKAILLTGDRHLRKAAEVEKVEVHGTLWLMDQLVKNRIIKPLEAINALNTICTNNGRLPRGECEKRIKYWENLEKQGSIRGL